MSATESQISEVSLGAANFVLGQLGAVMKLEGCITKRRWDEAIAAGIKFQIQAISEPPC